MPEISRFYGIVIKMYFADHAPPHFHAEYAEFECPISERHDERVRSRGDESSDPMNGMLHDATAQIDAHVAARAPS